MTTKTTTVTEAAGPGRGGRMSRQRKRDAVLRLLRGEDLETLSRALGVTAATLNCWRDAVAMWESDVFRVYHAIVRQRSLIEANEQMIKFSDYK
jgi:hypothetical protein